MGSWSCWYPWNKYADSLPKLESTWLLQWSLVPLPSYCQNSLHPMSQMGDVTFPHPLSQLNCPIPTVSSLKLVLSRPICLSFPPSLPTSKPLTIVVSSHKENPSCSACEHLLHDQNHLFLDCFAFELLCKSIFGFAVCTLTSGSTVGSL